MNKEENNQKSEIPDIINNNTVDGELDAVSALSEIFKQECAKAVLKGVENKQDLIDFMDWLNKEKKLGFTSVGIERIVENYIHR